MAMHNMSVLGPGGGSDLARAATTSLLGLLQAHRHQQNNNHHLLNAHYQYHEPPTVSSNTSFGYYYINSTPKAYRTATGVDEEDEGDGACRDWQAAQHTLFQLANLCMAVSFLTPASFRFHLLFLRCLLLLAFLLFILWAGLFICMPDVLGWNMVFFMLNGAHIAWLFYTHLPTRMPQTHNGLYNKVFKPIRVGQPEFLELCELGSLHELHKGGLYAMEGITHCGHKVSVLLKGRLKVTYQRLFLHYVDVNQFVDAAEFDSLSDHSEKYQVSIAATEDSTVLSWEVASLQAYLSTHPFMKTLVHYLIGKDVCSHLYSIQEQLLQAPDYMSTLASRHSSMVNVRSCLAANDSSASLQRMGDFGGCKHHAESAPSSSATSPNTGETRV